MTDRTRLVLTGLLGLSTVACFLVAATGPTEVGVRTFVTPTPTPSPSPGTSATPVDPCKASVTAINLSGPLSVKVGDVFRISVTPVSASGPLEGSLDRCNNGRVPFVESMSDNLRCVGECSGYGPQFAAEGVGSFLVRIRVDAVSQTFGGTVTR